MKHCKKSLFTGNHIEHFTGLTHFFKFKSA